MFTALHRELGIPPSAFTYDMLVLAVAQDVAERVDLDWKQQLPDKHSDSKWRNTLAKDFAAMANAGGGVFVYGIAEDRKTTKAAKLVDIGEVKQTHERELRQIAYSLVQPGIPGFETYPLQSVSGEHALIVRIPASTQVPHLVPYTDAPDYLGAPVRRGAQTFWLSEAEIESAYRTRFRSTGDRLRELDSAFQLEVDSLAPWTGLQEAWLTAVAHPLEPRSAMLTQPSARDASTALDLGADLYARIIENRKTAQTYDSNVRPGRRRWSTNRRYDEKRMEHVGLDGSVVVSQRVGELTSEDGVAILGISTLDVERAAAHAVATIAGVSRTLMLNGPHLVQVAVHAESDAPMRFGIHSLVRRGPVFSGLPVYVSQVQAEIVEVNGSDEDELLRASMAEITTLMTSQGGMVHLDLTSPRDGDAKG